jgi:hypothetical protein
MLLPFPLLVKSRLQTRRKVILLGLFGLGIFITVIQIIRIQTVKQLSNYIDSAPLILWSAVENNLGIIVANVPTLAPLVKYYNERTSRGTGNSATHRITGAGTAGGRYYAQGSRSGVGKSVDRSMGMTTLRESTHCGTELGSFDRGKGHGSTDSILDRVVISRGSCAGDGGDEEKRLGTSAGITKKVEVVVTRT